MNLETFCEQVLGFVELALFRHRTGQGIDNVGRKLVIRRVARSSSSMRALSLPCIEGECVEALRFSIATTVPSKVGGLEETLCVVGVPFVPCGHVE